MSKLSKEEISQFLFKKLELLNKEKQEAMTLFLLSTICSILSSTSFLLLFCKIYYKFTLNKDVVEISLLVFFFSTSGFMVFFLNCLLIKKLRSYLFYRFLHTLFLPHKKTRHSALLSITKESIKQEEAKFLNNDKFKNLTKEGLKEWVDEYIMNIRSIHNLINLQCLGTDSLRSEHLYWSQLIPRNKLNIDQFRDVLDKCPLTSVLDLAQLNDVNLNQLELLFKDYKASDIVRIFKSNYNISHLVEIINISMKNELTLPIFVDMKLLCLYVKKIDDNMFFDLKRTQLSDKIEGSSPLGNIRFISNAIELDEVGRYMQNCLRNKNNISREICTGSYQVYMIDSCEIVFMINTLGSLVEAKHKANRKLSDKDRSTLIKFLREKVV